MPINPEIKAKWIAALRSGKYTQGCGALRRSKNSRQDLAHCCLGVLADIHAPNDWVARESQDTDYMGVFYKNTAVARNEGVLNNDFMDRMGLTIAGADKLVDMNDDDRKSFQEIADFIEKRLEDFQEAHPDPA